MVSPYRGEGRPLLSHPGESALNFYSYQLAEALAAQGTEITIIGPRDGTETRDWRDGEVLIKRRYRRGRVTAGWEVVDGIINSSARIVHLQHELFAYGGLPTALAFPLAMRHLRSFRCRLLTTIHGVIPLSNIDADFVKSNKIVAPVCAARFVWRWLIRQIAQVSDVVHVHEQRLADLLADDYGVRNRPLHIIPLGSQFPPQRLPRSASRQKLDLPLDADVVLFFGYLSSYKGVDELLRDLPMAMARRPRLHVIIAGQVPKRLHGSVDFRETLRDLEKLGSRIHVLGFVPENDIKPVFGAADVLILPYTVAMSASGPMSLALSYGVPTLLSEAFAPMFPDAPGLFAARPTCIAAAIDRFFRETAFRVAVEQFSSSLAKTRSWQSVAAAMSSLYASL